MLIRSVSKKLQIPSFMYDYFKLAAKANDIKWSEVARTVMCIGAICLGSKIYGTPCEGVEELIAYIKSAEQAAGKKLSPDKESLYRILEKLYFESRKMIEKRTENIKTWGKKGKKKVSMIKEK